jgi:hypothetical protein
MLEEAIFPAVTRTAAKKGDVEHLKQLRAMVRLAFVYLI